LSSWLQINLAIAVIFVPLFHKNFNITMKNYLLAIFFSSITLQVFAQQGLIWSTEIQSNISIDSEPLMAIDMEYNIILACDAVELNGNHDIMLAKVAPDGTMLWQTTFNGDSSLNDHVEAIALDVDGNIFLTGNTQTEFVAGGDLVLSEDEVLIAKFSKDGLKEWHRTFPVSQWREGSIGRALAIDSSGNCYVTGNRQPEISGPETFFLTKFDSNGNTVWDIFDSIDSLRTIGLAVFSVGDTIRIRGYKESLVQPYNRTYFTFLFDKNSNIFYQYEEQPLYYPGETFDSPIGECRVAGGYYDKYSVIAFNWKGELTWSHQEPTNAQQSYGKDGVADIIVDGYGNSYATGHFYINDAVYTDILTMKISSEGNVQWKAVTNNSWGGKALDMDDVGNLIIAGHSGVQHGMILVKIDTFGNEIGRLYTENILPSDLKIIDDESFIVIGNTFFNGKKLVVQKYDIVLANNEIKIEYKPTKSYPNPATSEVLVNIPNQDFNAQKIGVFDNLGRNIYANYSYSKNVIKIDVEDFLPGFYHCLLFGQNITYSTSFIVLH
jgi:hypothetical protein